MSKSLYLFILFISLGFVACDNDMASSQVPSVVKNTLKTHFPHPTDIEWETLNDDYQVSFEIKNIDHKALLDGTGNLLKHKYKVDKNMLPNSIISLLEQKYPQEKWSDPEHIIDGNSDYFQLNLDDFFKEKKLVVDGMGKVLFNVKYWN